MHCIRGDDWIWRVSLNLNYGDYAYKFMVDGNWAIDEYNSSFEDDGYGGSNSVINCPRSDRGMGFSLAESVSKCYDWEGLLVILGDMPFVNPETYLSLANALRDDAICIPIFEGNPGNPVAFGRSFFSSLEKLDGDVGAKNIVQANTQAVIEIPVSDKGILIDIDTPDDVVNSHFSY